MNLVATGRYTRFMLVNSLFIHLVECLNWMVSSDTSITSPYSSSLYCPYIFSSRKYTGYYIIWNSNSTSKSILLFKTTMCVDLKNHGHYGKIYLIFKFCYLLASYLQWYVCVCARACVLACACVWNIRGNSKTNYSVINAFISEL
jgi:hypothetical protein